MSLWHYTPLNNQQTAAGLQEAGISQCPGVASAITVPTAPGSAEEGRPALAHPPSISMEPWESGSGP